MIGELEFLVNFEKNQEIIIFIGRPIYSIVTALLFSDNSCSIRIVIFGFAISKLTLSCDYSKIVYF